MYAIKQAPNHRKKVYIDVIPFLLFAISDAALWVLIQDWLLLKALLALLAVLFLVCIAYFYRAKWMFAAEGGDIQNKILDELTSRVEWNGSGRALDIGCGSGYLPIRLAKKYREAKITGTDYWGQGGSLCRHQHGFFHSQGFEIAVYDWRAGLDLWRKRIIGSQKRI